MTPILSIIIVEYKGIEEIQECISSIKAHLRLPYEVIVSSNSCYSAEEQTAINHTEECVTWLFNERNGGFAYAMNEGMKNAHGKYRVIMNSDCTFEGDISNMIDFLDHHPEIGAAGPKMLDEEGNIQDTARPYVSLPRFLWRQFRRVTKHEVSVLDKQMDYSRVQTVDWVIGAFIMVSEAAYQATGGLDTNFFMYAEDLDWCTRIRQSGFEVVYYPKTIIRYKGTRRARSNSKYAKIFLQSHLGYWKKFGFCWGYPKRKVAFFD